MLDLKVLFEEAAAHEEPATAPTFDDLVARHRRRRARRATVITAALGLAIAGVSLGVSQAVSHDADQLRVSDSHSGCSARNLGELRAAWSLHRLVLSGTVRVTNTSTTACQLAPLDVELDDAQGRELQSEGAPVMVDHLPPADSITLPAGASAEATLRWGGSYCGPPTGRVVLAVHFQSGAATVPVTGPVLRCLGDTTYYRHGQSTAAITGFRRRNLPAL